MPSISPYSNLKNFSEEELSALANALRILSIDMVEKAGSGHPGMPLGVADILTILFAKFMRFDPKSPKWINRDRFILSAGHGSAILYSLFYLLGYEDAKLEELQNFRQLHSKAAGHPEFGFFEGIETTTGPLGQGIANAVGMAISAEVLKAKDGNDLVNNKTFVLGGDGCFMEGISFEAMSLAGHLKLSNLVVIYDKNDITIDGKLSLADSTDFIKRFESVGFNVFKCDGHNFVQIEDALSKAIASDKPSVIIAETKIGKFSSSKEGSEKSHGSPLGKEDITSIKLKFLADDEPFKLKEESVKMWRDIGKNASIHHANWKKFESKPINSFDNVSNVILKIKEELFKERPSKATRQHSGNVLAKFAEAFPNLIGGSADLSESNNAKSKASKAITAGDFSGNYIHYGIREHAMAGIMNGIAVYGGFKAYGSTFLVFSDYMRPAIRLAALMKLPTIYILTHDSISLGEDGPTHQPIEHLTSLRIIPNLNVFRPADSIETVECLEIALSSTSTPSVIALSRQAVKEVTPFRRENLSAKGAYFARFTEGADLTIYATGSEVSLAFEVMEELSEFKISIVSMVCFEVFEQQDETYKSEILKTGKRIFIEAGIKGLMANYIREGDLFFGLYTFGESGKPSDVLKHFGLEKTSIANKIRLSFI